MLSSIIILGVLTFGSYVLGCFDADKCDLLVDPSFSLGWCRFRESWRIVRARPTDIEILPKTTLSMSSDWGKGIKYKKPILKIAASTGGATILESRKYLVPQAGDVSVDYTILVENDLTPGYIRIETAGGVVLGEHKFQFVPKKVWTEASIKFNLATPNQYIVIKIAMIPESSFWTAYFGYIHACYTQTDAVIKKASNDFSYSAWKIYGNIYDDNESKFYTTYGGRQGLVKKFVHSKDFSSNITRSINVNEGDCITVSSRTSYSTSPPKLVLLVDGVEVDSKWKPIVDDSWVFTGVFKAHSTGYARIALELPQAPKSCDYFYMGPVEIFKKDCPAIETVEAVSTDLY